VSFAACTNNFNRFKSKVQLLTELRDGDSTVIPLSALKALFFVREFTGDPTRVVMGSSCGPPIRNQITERVCDGCGYAADALPVKLTSEDASLQLGSCRSCLDVDDAFRQQAG
jgi:hypothetical protein